MANPYTAQIETGVRPSLRTYKRYSLVSSEQRVKTGTTPEVAQSWQDSDRDASSVIYHQSNPLLTNGHLSYNPNTPDNQPYHAEITQVHRGQDMGGVKSASSIPTSLLERQSSRGNPFLHEQSRNGEPPGSAQNANTQDGHYYNGQPPIIRASSNVQQERPLTQSAPLVWKLSDAQKSDEQAQIPRSGSLTPSESRSKHKTVWQPSDYSPVLSGTGRHWSSVRVSKGHHSDNKETSGFAGASLGATSHRIESSKFLIAPSLSNSLPSAVIKPNPSPDKLTSSITHFSQGVFSPSGNEKSSYRRVQSYLLRDSQASDTIKGLKAAYSTPSSQVNPVNVHSGHDFNLQTELDQAKTKSNLFNINSNDGQVGNVIRYYPSPNIYRAESSLQPRTDALTMNNFKEIQANSAYSSAKDSISRPVSVVTRAPVNPYENGQYTRSHLKSNTQPSIISDKIANPEARVFRVRPSLLGKYSFGQRKAWSTSAPGKTLRDSSPDLFDATPTPPKSLTFQEVPLTLLRNNATDRNSGSRYIRYKSPQGHEGYTSRPLSVSNNQVENGDAIVGSSSGVTSTQGQSVPRIEDVQPLGKTTGDLKLVRLIRVKPKSFTKHAKNVNESLSNDGNVTIVRQARFKAVTYDDVLGSASFSSFTPTSTDADMDNSTATNEQTGTVNLTDASRSPKRETEVESVSRNKLDSQKGELESQLQLSYSTGREPKSRFLHDMSSDTEENLSELNYLRTSTGNVSFQSINLNLK